MHNLEAVLPSIETLTQPLGMHFSASKVGWVGNHGEQQAVRAAAAPTLLSCCLSSASRNHAWRGAWVHLRPCTPPPSLPGLSPTPIRSPCPPWA